MILVLQELCTTFFQTLIYDSFTIHSLLSYKFIKHYIFV